MQRHCILLSCNDDVDAGSCLGTMAIITESAVVVLAVVCAGTPQPQTPWQGTLVVPAQLPAGKSPDICWPSGPREISPPGGLAAPGHGAFKGFSLWKHFPTPLALKNYMEKTLLKPPGRQQDRAGRETG